MDKISFSFYGFIFFLYRIKFGYRNSDERFNEFLRFVGILANRIFYIVTVISTFDNYLSN